MTDAAEQSPTPIILSWSCGKDSALALIRLLRDPAWRVTGLLTTVTDDYDRVSIHGIRRPLLHAQARAVGLPVHEVMLPAVCSNDDYESAFGAALDRIGSTPEAPRHIAFGDIFLEDVRAYRERLVARHGWSPVFPLWNEPSKDLAREMMRERIAARLVCVDTEALDAEFAGRMFDEELLADLSDEVDPCGERGEFHTFVSDASCFDAPVPVRTGERVLRDGRFMYVELQARGSEARGSEARLGGS